MKKAFSIIGMISGLALTIIGILVLFGVFGGEACLALDYLTNYRPSDTIIAKTIARAIQ